MATTEDWLYTDDLEESLAEGGSRGRLESIDSRLGDDLLDDVLTAPSRAHNATPPNADELLGVKIDSEAMEESGSARFNADQMTRTVQARLESNKTSQGILGSGGSLIYSREPNRKNSIFIGNLTWWTTDLDLVVAMAESGLGEVKNVKFYENRTNGQSKGYALLELSSEQLAITANEKLQEVVIHKQKPFVMYALKVSPHTFEAKCISVKSGIPSSSLPVTSSTNGFTASGFTASAKIVAPRPSSNTFSAPSGLPMMPPMPGLPPGMPPPHIPGMPPGFPGAGMMNHSLPGLAGLLPPRFPPVLPGSTHGFGLPYMPGMEHMKTAGAHLNPAFLHDMTQGGSGDASKNTPQNMMELFSRFRNMAAQGGVGTGGGSVPMSMDGGGGSRLSEDEASDANQRNRAISSSAIHRALSYSKTGEFEDAIDTLNLAIGLIKQSVTGHTETSHIIIQTLSDCLRGVEEQSSAMSKRSRRDHRSHDDRGSRSHGHRSKHHRDRSRERRR